MQEFPKSVCRMQRPLVPGLWLGIRRTSGSCSGVIPGNILNRGYGRGADRKALYDDNPAPGRDGLLSVRALMSAERAAQTATPPKCVSFVRLRVNRKYGEVACLACCSHGLPARDGCKCWQRLSLRNADRYGSGATPRAFST